MNVETMTDEELESVYEILKKKEKINYSDMAQLALKVVANALYGAISNNHFIFYDLNFATAITLTGQMYIKTVIKNVNYKLNKMLKGKKIKYAEKVDPTDPDSTYDFIVFSDTDSLGVNLHDLVLNFYDGDINDVQKVTDWINDFSKNNLAPYINKVNDTVGNYLNVNDKNIMFMKQEVIADKSIFLGKKRYIMNKIDDEGVRYHTGKLKMQGLEVDKSTTPKIFQEYLKKSILIILDGGEEPLNAYFKDIKSNIRNENINDLAFTTSVNDINKYKVSKDEPGLYKKGTPQNVKCALLYNHIRNRFNLYKECEEILGSDKIKYIFVRRNNPITGLEEAIGYPGDEIPEPLFELLEPYIDYDKIFEKGYENPLRSITDTIGFYVSENNNVADFFN